MPSRVPSHRPARLAAPSRHRDYDRFARDASAAKFYSSAVWRRCRALKLRIDPLCERCKASGSLVSAAHVHHKQERRDRPDLELELSNLESLCAPCHSRHHAGAGTPAEG